MRFLDKHTQRDKRLLALERELNRLHRAHYHVPIIPLERPYQRGWVKFYVLEERVRRRPDASLFGAILQAVNQRVYCRERNFINRGGQPVVLRPRVIPGREWLKLAWPASHQRYFGYGCWRLEDRPWTPVKYRPHIIGFKLFQFWWLREEIQPHLITHQRVDLPEVRSRIAEIETLFNESNGRARLDWLHGHSRWWRRYQSTARDLRSNDYCSAQLQDGIPD